MPLLTKAGSDTFASTILSLLHKSWVPSFGICYHERLYKPDQEVTEAGLPHQMEHVTSCSKLENYANMED